MRLLQLGAEWQTEVAGGVNTYTYGLSKALVDQTESQEWIVVGKNPHSISLNCHVIPAATSDQSIFSRWKSIRHEIRSRIAQNNLVTSHFALYAHSDLPTLRSSSHVVHFHGPWADESAVEGAGRISVVLKRLIERRVYKTADRVITLSEAFKRVAVERYDVDPAIVRVVPGGVDYDRFSCSASREEARGQLGWPLDRPIVLCLRRLSRRMGLSNLISAASELRQQVPDALILIGGKGPVSDELGKQIQKAGLTDHVRLLGFVADEDLPLAYRSADISIVPTEALEGFGLIALESLAAGTPVLVTPIGGLPEVVTDFCSDLIMPGSDAGSIAESMKAALTGGLSLPTKDVCREYVQSHFAWPLIAKRITDVYQEVIQ